MENMGLDLTEMQDLFKGVYKNKKVLITGHTGFKGSWLALWLHELGANVTGYSLPPPTTPNHFDLLHLDINSIIGDIRDRQQLESVFHTICPEIVFHLAAQSLVLDSYQDPVGTFETNIMGTVNIFDIARKTDSVRAIINVTSDKCYENREWVWGYRESDPMGGYDPYSASKGCSEIVTSSFRNSFFNTEDFGKGHHTLIASARAGNVIGGGDWGKDRLVPDMVKAVGKNEVAIIRNPDAIRPWQHVLDPLSGYLLLGMRLLKNENAYADAWNFGPKEISSISVGILVEMFQQHWPRIRFKVSKDKNSPHESRNLRLDVSKAAVDLRWESVWDTRKTIEMTIEWYMSFYDKGEIISRSQLKEYITDSIRLGNLWTT